MLFVGVITVIFVMAAVVIDVGLWLAERRSAQRAADLAAAAGAQDLLASDSDAVAAAYDWAARNGYDASSVSVELLCSNQLDNATGAICNNTGPPDACTAGETCDSVRVTISKPSTMLFSSIFDIDGFDIEAGATAGLTIDLMPVAAAVVLDATGSMGAAPCVAPSYAQPGCPIKEARDAANVLVDILLGGINDQNRGAYTAYNACYNPPSTDPGCIGPSNIVGLTSNAASLHAAIGTTTPRGGTNICLALDKTIQLLNGATERKVVILLTDGDNNFSYNSTNFPPSVCGPPATPTPTPGPTPTPAPQCGTPTLAEREVDLKTKLRADALKAAGAEIFVVGLSVCPGTSSAPDCSAIGNADADGISDRRLLKCIASGGDHYAEISTASEVPDAFRQIAGAIISRGLLE